MTGLVRKAILLGVCGLILAATASANVPDPTKSIAGLFIKVGGTHTETIPGDGQPDPTIAYTVTVNDFNTNPIAGSTVEINFSNCPDTKLCTVVVAGQTLDCVNKAVRGSTNAAGQITFKVLGASDNPGTVIPPAIHPGAGSGCVRIYADGIQLGSATSVVYDQNGSLPGGNGVSGLDLSVAKTDVGAVGLGGQGLYKGRTDYNVDGLITGVDLSYQKDNVGKAGLGIGSGQGCYDGGAAQPYCP